MKPVLNQKQFSILNSNFKGAKSILQEQLCLKLSGQRIPQSPKENFLTFLSHDTFA